MANTIQRHEWTRIPTSPTKEEDYAEPLPATPFIDRWEPYRTPWLKILLLVVAVELVSRALWR